MRSTQHRGCQGECQQQYQLGEIVAQQVGLCSLRNSECAFKVNEGQGRIYTQIETCSASSKCWAAVDSIFLKPEDFL